MPDSVISVRMPETLMDELEQTASEQHFMDLSEAVRSLIRKKITEKRMENVRSEATREQLITGLQRLINQLENGAEQGQ